MKNYKKIGVIILFFTTVIFGCKKDSFTFNGKWTIQYDFSGTAGTFIANFKSNGKWDLTDGGISNVDEGNWESKGDSIIFTFEITGTDYRGIKTGNNTLSGKIVPDDGGPGSGVWSGTK